MNILEAYSLLFVDTFSANIIFYRSGEMVLPSMLALGGYDTTLVFMVGVAAYLCAFLVNFWLGIMLCKIYKSSVDIDSSLQIYTKVQNIFVRHGKLILCFSPIPIVGPLINVLAGFIRFSLSQALLIAMVSKVADYAFLYATKYHS